MEHIRVWSWQPEFAEVLKALDEIGEPHPNVLLPCVAFVQRHNGQITGISILQCVPLIEPFLATTGKNSIALLREVEKFVEQTKIPRLLMHTEDENMEKAITKHGARRSQWTWYERRAVCV